MMDKHKDKHEKQRGKIVGVGEERIVFDAGKPYLVLRQFLILFALAFVLLVLRRPDAVLKAQFWAEDGVQFFSAQAMHGSWRTLFEPYAGYLHLIPRLVAAGASPLPARLVPLFYNLSAFMIAAWCCCVFSLPWYRPLLKSDSLRALLCLLMATSFYADELIGTITNVQWFLFVPALLILIAPTEIYQRMPRWAFGATVLLLLVIGLSAPLVAILFPLALWSARRCRRTAVISAALILAVLIQVGLALLGSSVDRPGFSRNPVELATSVVVAFTYRVVLSSVAGHRMAQAISTERLGAVALAALLAVALGATIAWWRGDSSHRRRIVITLYLLFASLLLAMSGRSTAKLFLTLSQLPQWRYDRYFFAGACLFAYLVGMNVERWFAKRAPVIRVLILLAVFVCGLIGNFRAAVFGDYDWPAYAPAIDQWSRAVRSGTAVAGFAIPINPPPIELHLPNYTPGRRGMEFSPIDQESTVVLPERRTANRIPSRLGVFRSGFFWVLDVNGDGKFQIPPDLAFGFGGIAGDIPITGDWNGSGRTKAGIYRSSNGVFLLDYDGDGKFTDQDKWFKLNIGIQAGDVPVAGDWNGDGRAKVGLYRHGRWLLDYNGDGVFEAGVDKSYEFGGAPGDVPVVGDWNGSGVDKIGLVRDGVYWVLDANGNGRFDGLGSGRDIAFSFRGQPGDVPVTGDWNGDGRSKPGLFRSGAWILDFNGNYRYDGVGPGGDLTATFGGAAGDRPVVGRW